jgi:poly(ADP-ribose) glycohydrolase ARH3
LLVRSYLFGSSTRGEGARKSSRPERYKPVAATPSIAVTSVSLESKFLGAMVGSAVGDAIGELAFHAPERARLEALVEHLDILRYTDDTAMAIGLAESLVHVGAVDHQHLGETFRRNYRREPWRGYASGPPTLFAQVERSGLSYREAAQRLFGGEGSLGNGAAMRIAPLGIFLYNSPQVYEQAAASAEVTHAHPVGKDGAAVLALSVALAVGLDPRQEFAMEHFLAELVASPRTETIREKMALVRSLLAESAGPDAAARRLGRTVAVHESMPFVVYSFLRHASSFEECLFCAVLHGGDRDTLGAMACGLSGAYLGIDAIPGWWRNKLENLQTVEGLARELWKRTTVAEPLEGRIRRE